jgi:hypothetical protein
MKRSAKLSRSSLEGDFCELRQPNQRLLPLVVGGAQPTPSRQVPKVCQLTSHNPARLQSCNHFYLQPGQG